MARAAEPDRSRRRAAAEPPDAARATTRTVPVGPAVVVVALAVLIAWNLANQPPAVHPDGGFPAAEAAGARILAATGAGDADHAPLAARLQVDRGVRLSR